jgi:hypothetical protein
LYCQVGAERALPREAEAVTTLIIISTRMKATTIITTRTTSRLVTAVAAQLHSGSSHGSERLRNSISLSLCSPLACTLGGLNVSTCFGAHTVLAPCSPYLSRVILSTRAVVSPARLTTAMRGEVMDVKSQVDRHRQYVVRFRVLI